MRIKVTIIVNFIKKQYKKKYYSSAPLNVKETNEEKVKCVVCIRISNLLLIVLLLLKIYQYRM